ncbi:MAG: GIY-YIG nuclease family protein [Bacteroidaceae bacterium]|nr:GIY-YIG nuclease family protein [Bacteroidaceae bacterium]
MSIEEELEDLFDDPLLEISEQEKKLFDIPADMRLIAKRKQADYVAQYKPCEDFDNYRDLFLKIHAELRTGLRSIVKIGKQTSLVARRYYLVDGVMLYLESIGTLTRGANGMLDGRTRCVLENGTETDILLGTLRKNVVGNGYGITETQEEAITNLNNNNEIQDGDVSTGYIYVLKSKSQNPDIANIQNLYKIGFTINSVEERIANAENEPTYLMSPVDIIAKYRIINMNSHVFETLIHQMLDSVQMQFSITDSYGSEHHPKEWFVVPFDVIETIISKILDGTIVKYTYNPSQQCLEKIVKSTTSALDVSGFKVLTLIIKKVYFDAIIDGSKTIEYRQLKQTTLKKYTYIDETDGKRYLKWYDMLRLCVGYDKNRETALVQVTDITFNEGIVEYHLGQVLEHIVPK